ncbi:MAG: hypothetical protein HQL95_03720 [Magnetococcales bacterium]|nr:hypothetical protein [Magnetococcales bacterium]
MTLKARRALITLLVLPAIYYFVLAMFGLYRTNQWNFDLDQREVSKLVRVTERIGKTIKDKFGTREWGELQFGAKINYDKWGIQLEDVEKKATRDADAKNDDIVTLNNKIYELRIYQFETNRFMVFLFSRIEPDDALSLWDHLAILLPGTNPLKIPHVRTIEFNSEGRELNKTARSG